MQTLQALRRPSEGADVQVVFWSYGDNDSSVDCEMLNVLGLGMKLDVEYFRLLLTSLDDYNTHHDLAKCLFIARKFVAIAYDCPLVRPGLAPIVLIAGPREMEDRLGKKNAI